MKTIFVVNPCAGQGKNIKNVVDLIDVKALSSGFDYDIYITCGVGDATRFVHEYCTNHGCARFIACGGDGTFSEVLNGIVGFDDAEVGIIPLGTGNDFCRNFGGEFDFHDVIKQISGITVKCDAIRYTTHLRDGIHTGYCANMFNIGFDCNVADMTADMKKRPFISGSLAYLISIFATLVKKKGTNLEIQTDGETLHHGPLLLTSIANGCYCGGGIKSNPLADITDGYININIVNNVSRFKFIKLLPHYIKGDFLKLKDISKVVLSLKCKKVIITPKDGLMRICNDGEISDAGYTEFEIKHKAFNFVLPAASNSCIHIIDKKRVQKIL